MRGNTSLCQIVLRFNTSIFNYILIRTVYELLAFVLLVRTSTVKSLSA